MAYSIGNKELPVLQDNTSSTIGAIGDAFKAINGSFDKLANLPWLARNLVQENADARYSAALNKYSNDPDGLAKALANGNIDTSNVTANTLNQTQNRLKDIGNNYSRSYLQGRTENLNKYLEGQGGKDYLTAVGLAQQGKNIDNFRNNANAPAEAISLWDKLDPVTQQNIARQQALAGAGLSFAQQKYNDELAGMSSLFDIARIRAMFGQVDDPIEQQDLVNQFLSGKIVAPDGTVYDLSGRFKNISKSPKAIEAFNSSFGIPNNYIPSSAGALAAAYNSNNSSTSSNSAIRSTYAPEQNTGSIPASSDSNVSNNFGIYGRRN